MEKIGHPISRKWGKEGLILKPYPYKYGIMTHTKGASERRGRTDDSHQDNTKQFTET
jgi:hypothetical protein